VDVVGAGLTAVAYHRANAPVLVFSAGVLSSIGPCVAPRLLALAACVTNARRPLRVTLAFVVGLVAAYAAFGAAASLLGQMRALQAWIYAVVAIAAIVGGAWQLVAARPHVHGEPHVGTAPSLPGVALLGASFAFVVSPCCTPLVVAIAAYAANAADPWYGVALLATFALGHAVPLFVTALGGVRFGRFLGRVVHAQAVGIVSGALMLGLGAYYALLV
jgi:cytochrome c biogenesis protein CcdA